MEIVLALLRTLIFVVATVAATVYVGRRIGRGRPLLWTGTTLLTLYWLVLFGWTSYLTGNANPSADLSIWVGWGGHLLPFFAALAYIWGIGQSAGFPARSGAGAGASLGKGSQDKNEPVEPSSGATGTPAPQSAPASSTAGQSTPAPPASPATGTQRAAQPFPAPHAVPVVMTPADGGTRSSGQGRPGGSGDSERPSGQS